MKRRRFRVAAYDYGIKQNILRMLIDHHCEVLVVPAQTSAEDVLGLGPDGVFLSNGPGDPEPVDYAVENIRKLIGQSSGVWNLPRAPALRAGAGRKNVQAEIRASRFESPGAESADAENRNYRAESWVLRGSGVAAFE